MDSQNTLRQLQLVELKILLEIKRVCDLVNIKYFLIGGTLLGAVRHGGFIPWDDDIDIGMLRDDYNRFLDVFPQLSNNEYFLGTYNTDEGHVFSFAKIRLNGTQFCEPRNEHVLENQGVWVDIFPFDNSSDSKIIRKLHHVHCALLETTVTRKYGYRDARPSVIHRYLFDMVCCFISIMLSKDFLLSYREKVIQKYNLKHTKFIYNWPFKTAEAKCFDELTELPFETVLFPVPKMYHEYLTSFYGDYMRIPPENERPKHSPYEPDFGKYAYIKTLDDVLPKKE